MPHGQHLTPRHEDSALSSGGSERNNILVRKTSYRSNHSKLSGRVAKSPPARGRDELAFSTPQQPGATGFNFQIAKSYVRSCSQAPESYHDEDSEVMSERGLDGSLDGPKSKASEHRLPRPMAYHLKLVSMNRPREESTLHEPSLARIEPFRIKNRATIPSKKNIEFTLQTSPKE